MWDLTRRTNRNGAENIGYQTLDAEPWEWEDAGHGHTKGVSS